MNSSKRKPRVRSVVAGLSVLAILTLPACSHSTTSPTLTEEQAATTARSVRAFAAKVAADVTQRGPIAWSSHFAQTPNFFMASEGQIVFANGEEATRGIRKLTETISHIELSWGEPLHVDPLTPTLVAVGMPYHEILIDKTGHKVEVSGYFTGLAEQDAGGWKFRNAHWSMINSAAKAP